MAQQARTREWQPLPSDVADWMGSVQEPPAERRPAATSARDKELQLPEPRRWHERVLRLIVSE